MGDSKGKFPRAYIEDVREEDPIMKRTHQDKLDIGARSSGLPKGNDTHADEATLSHVGESATGKGK